MINQGIEVNLAKLVAITQNRGDNRIFWLDEGTETHGFLHILQKHDLEFENTFGVYRARDIDKFIFDTISKKYTCNEWVAGPDERFYVYEIDGKYLKVLVDGEGEILSAFPSDYMT